MSYSGIKEDKRLIKAVPGKRQLAYENMEFFCFIHFTVNTFTGSEWGDGKESESIYAKILLKRNNGRSGQRIKKGGLSFQPVFYTFFTCLLSILYIVSKSKSRLLSFG